MAGVLNGMRVVEGSAFVAVPLAGMTMAQMGADVIRFDRLGGGLDATRWPVAANGLSHFWAGMNKGKRSIAVDMQSDRGRELVTQIITAPGEDAGMFLTNLKVRGWMDHETLSKHRKDLIMVALKGDRHGRPAVDYTVNPALGFPAITGSVGSEEPVAHALPAWDCIAGQMMVSALLAADRHRLRTGDGQDVEFSLKDVAAPMLGNLGIIGDTATGGAKRQKSGNALYGAYGQDFICADGERVMLIGLTRRQWQGIVKVTGTGAQMDQLAARLGANFEDEGQRYIHRDAITEVLKPWFAQRVRAEIGTLFDDNSLTCLCFAILKRRLHMILTYRSIILFLQILKRLALASFLCPAHLLISRNLKGKNLYPLPPLGCIRKRYWAMSWAYQMLRSRNCLIQALSKARITL